MAGSEPAGRVGGEDAYACEVAAWGQTRARRSPAISLAHHLPRTGPPSAQCALQAEDTMKTGELKAGCTHA